MKKINYKKTATIRYYAGAVFNILLLCYMLSEIIDGGMYDFDWDYRYNIYHQWMIVATCAVSAIADIMASRNVKYSVFLLLISNLAYWIYCALLFSMDPKTCKSYFSYAILPILIVYAILSLFTCYVETLKNCAGQQLNA